MSDIGPAAQRISTECGCRQRQRHWVCPFTFISTLSFYNMLCIMHTRLYSTTGYEIDI